MLRRGDGELHEYTGGRCCPPSSAQSLVDSSPRISNDRMPNAAASASSSAFSNASSNVSPSTISATGNVFTANLTGASEVPLAGRGTGSLEAKLERQSRILTYTLTYSGLSGAATAAHFHGPALPRQNAGVVLPTTLGRSSPIGGSATLTSAQVVEIIDGKWYVNVHTAKFPDGEARWQVVVKP